MQPKTQQTKLTAALFALCVAALVWFAAAHAQTSAPAKDNVLLARKPLATLDCELVGGRIYVPVQVNGHAARAVLDTGAGGSVMDLALADAWQLPMQGVVNATGGGGSGVTGKMLNGVNAVLGGLAEPLPYALPLGALAEKEGRPIEVIFGYHFFQTHLVEVDYARRQVRIFAAETEPEPGGTVLPLRIVANKPHIAAELVVGGARYKLEAHLDTGASNSSLSAKFLRAQPLEVPTTPPFVIGTGVGGAIQGRAFRPDAVNLGAIKLARPIVTMAETAGGALGTEARYDLNLGADLLQRFRVTFDYTHARLVLVPAADFAQPFEADKTGLRVAAYGPDLRGFKIIGVLAGSAAEAAGCRVGDFIETVDGKPAARFALHQLRELFRAPTPAQWKLGLKREGQQLTLTIAAKSII